MATRRMLPTRLFKDPDVMALSNNDMRLILIGFVLNADDEGRELAHAKLLGRELDYEPEMIEQALAELEANELLCCYVVGRHRYYHLTRWQEWETLSKPTPSKYPPPPSHATTRDPCVPSSQEGPGFPQNPLGNPGNAGETRPEGEEKGEGEQEQEQEQQKKRREGEEGAQTQPSRMVLIPPSRASTPSPSDSTSDTITALSKAQKVAETTTQVASILTLTEDAALARIVEEYLEDSTLSLLGEADAAREYIEDRQRNRKGTCMTPAFFRRWLKREHDETLRRQAVASAMTVSGSCPGTDGKAFPFPLAALRPDKSRARGAVLPPSLMHLEAQYQRAATSRVGG